MIYVVNRLSKELCVGTILLKIITLCIILHVLTGAIVVARNTEFLLDTNVTYISASSKQSYPAIAFDGKNYLVVWHDWRNKVGFHYGDSYYSDIYGCRVTPEGIVLDSGGIRISYCIHIAEHLPCASGIAYGSGMFLVTWSDFRQGLGGGIYGARIDTNGIVLDPDGFEISMIPGVLQGSPCVTFDGTNFFVVWYDQRISLLAKF
jgi:hypothetical protein